MKNKSSVVAQERSSGETAELREIRRHGAEILAQLDPDEFEAKVVQSGALKDFIRSDRTSQQILAAPSAQELQAILFIWDLYGTKRKPLYAARSLLVCEATSRLLLALDSAESLAPGSTARLMEVAGGLLGPAAFEVARLCQGIPSERQAETFWRAVTPWSTEFRSRWGSLKAAFDSQPQAPTSAARASASGPACPQRQIDVPDTTGFVREPTDDAAYASAKEILESEVGLNRRLSLDQLKGILRRKAPTIRWTRPAGRRLSIRRDDWARYIKESGPHLSHDEEAEVERRKAEVARAKRLTR